MPNVLRTLYIDIDSTIWDAASAYQQSAKELFGVDFDATKWYDVEELKSIFGEDYKQVFSNALRVDEVKNRQLYPGVVEALEDVYFSNFRLHFITHNFEPDVFEGPIRNWLERKLALPFKLSIFTEDTCKIEKMQDDPSAWGIVEDKSSTLEKAADEGYVTFAKEQPHNTLTVAKNLDIIAFDTWPQFTKLFKEALWLETVLAV